MLEFIQLLKLRYQTVATHASEAVKTLYQQRIDQLILTESFMRKGQMLEEISSFPLQITIVGPTQVGKSTVVNVLLNSSSAGVSPLAGFTVHAQGFCQGLTINDCNGLQRYFGRFQQLQQSELSKERYDCYSLTESINESSLLPQCILWDTPDFDSINSTTYREGVLRALGLADVIILVVSKEKYADQSVWEIMSMLEALHQPTLICLNKLTEGSEELLARSLKEKWQKLRTDDFPNLVPLYYAKQSGIPEWLASGKQVVKQIARQHTHKQQLRFEKELVKKYWNSWIEPIVTEHQAIIEWQNLVHETLQSAVASYQRDYQSQPHYYVTFQQALAELLILLEVPKFAGVLAGARKVLTWPVKQLTKIGQKSTHVSATGYESVLLKQIAEHTLIQIAERLLENAEHNSWWKEMGGLLRSRRSEILADFAHAEKKYQRFFQQDVEKSAQRLYKKLQHQPLVLNSLRASRITADAAVVVFAIHTGGLSLLDLVVAPAMLTITSLLTESAAGGYMSKVEAELKQQQLTVVKQSLFIESMANNLLALPELLPGITHFNITPAELNAAQMQLKDQKNGLRLL
jgi:GTPase Era involved in 16S rRNA processing